MERALIFDCDGVLGDTEPYGHLPAFNQMWKKCGIPWAWTKKQYGEKLRISGGKERMASLFNDSAFRIRVGVPKSEYIRKDLIAHWHKEKTVIYEQIINSGAVPARPGVKRLSQEALRAGWKLAVASTSAPSAVQVVLRFAVGDELAQKFLVLAGDIVQAKKPAPDIYNLALERLQVLPQNCVAIEDSRNGMLAAYAACIPVVVTISEFTVDEDFSDAELVVDSLGDPNGPRTEVLANRAGTKIGDMVELKNLIDVIEAATRSQFRIAG
ncbi:MAG: haloacid dehalogenase [Acidobacteria bacterium]|nr:MAG: haloacid dehalogenase [Acidobacteriota bacterium]